MTSSTWTLIAAVLGSGIVFLDSTVVNVALPRIGQELPRSLLGVLEGQSYVYNGYLLTLSALLILAGALNDFYGRRRMFALGLLAFGLTSILCGLAPTMELLVLFRVLQGAAGALLVPGSLALITAGFAEGEERGRAFGVWAGASAGTTIFGPVVGGLLVDSLSWRVAFLMNVPLVLVALWAVWKHVPESRDESASGRFDWLGAAVVAVGVGGLTFGAIYGQQREWRGPLAFVALTVGALATLWFPFLMARSRHPLVPLDLFRSRNFSVTNLSTLLIYGALYVTFYYLPLVLQGTLDYTATAVGLALVPTSVLLTLFSTRFGALSGKYGPRWFMAGGPLVMTLGLLWLARLSENMEAWRLQLGDPSTYAPPPSYWTEVFPGIILFGAGLTVMVAPLTTALMSSIPEHRSGLASAINNAISRVGPQLAGALIFVAITASFYRGLETRIPGFDASGPETRAAVSPLNPPSDGVPAEVATAARSASVDAFHLAMLVSAGLLLAGAAVNATGIRNPAPRTDVT